MARATERYCDDLIGKTEYDALCARAQADVQAAQSELASLETVEPTPQPPPLEVVLRDLGGTSACGLRLVAWDGDQSVAQKWSIVRLDPAPGYVAAVASAPPMRCLTLQNWSPTAAD